jgi:hypothetical protein
MTTQEPETTSAYFDDGQILFLVNKFSIKKILSPH